METYEIVSVGEKLKRLRKKYKVKQEALAGDEITRNLISQIEHNKVRLTENSARIMLQNLKQICNKRNIEVCEDIDYLMEDEKAQAVKIVDKYIDELKKLSTYKGDNFLSKLAQTEEFLADLQLKYKKIEVFNLAGDYFLSNSDFYKSALYYEKARALMEVDADKDAMILVLRKLSKVYPSLGQFEKNIAITEYAVNNFKNMDEKYYCIFIFNNALGYLMLNQYEKALEKLNIVEEIVKSKDKRKYVDVLSQKAYCLGFLKQYKEALKSYNKALQLVDSKTNIQMIIILVNICVIHSDLKDYTSTKKVMKNIFNNLKNFNENDKYIAGTYFEMAKILHRNLKELTRAKECYMRAVNIFEKKSEYYWIREMLPNLIELYAELENPEDRKEVKEKILELELKEGKVDTKIW
ncbi:helix-turn-helix domain-containing protein [Clostridium felsineum]|uniref:tetratricopeptide repeat protein n=1 Tax=Clostridium felsineum TaxID=36839 RepID=UPI00214D166C|nr:helix-turn-helix domain-containing protein [Clostridium felsineum]MCR3760029.1 helix-turn-helix domain-containing protein [Clostridium felsineum]